MTLGLGVLPSCGTAVLCPYRQSDGLVRGARAVRADGFVRHVSRPAFHPVVHADLADRAERLIVKSGDAQESAKFFIKLAKIFKVDGQRWKLYVFVSDEEFLVASIPEPRELALQHNRGRNGHLEAPVRFLPQLRAAAILFHAND